MHGSAIGCLYETSGQTLLAFAAQDSTTETHLVFGVSEQRKLFAVHLELTSARGPFTLLFAGRSPSPRRHCACCAGGSSAPRSWRRWLCRRRAAPPPTPPGTPSGRRSRPTAWHRRPSAPPRSAADY
ncbi:hypothetical protein ACFQ0Q_02220 [Streptomyces aureus]